MTSRLDKVLTIGFCALWCILVFIEYWYFHPEYGTSIQFFQYTDLTLALVGLGAAVGFGLFQIRKQEKLSFLANGLSIFVLLLIISALIIRIHFPKIGGNFTISVAEIATYLGKVTAVVAAAYFVFTTAFAVGDLLFNHLFSFSFNRGESNILKIATGLTVLAIILMFLGAINLLVLKIVLPILLLFLGLTWKGIWQFLNHTLLRPLSGIEQMNWLGFSCFYIILIFFSLLILSDIRPYPFGFDSLAIYLNLPKLIGENHGLIAGYSPYYWSLFISLGYILFDHIEVVIALSISGGVFAAFTIYEISRKWLDVNYSLLIAALLYSLPLINFQGYRDVKTDLGLLFILLSAVLVLMKWLSLEDPTAYKQLVNTNFTKKQHRSKTKKKKKPIIEKNITAQTTGILGKFLSQKTQLIILVGLFSGMAIGIKLTGLILIFSILSVFAFMKGGQIGFLTAFVLVFAIILLGGLEVATGLRAYHFGANQLKMIFPVIGLLGLGFLAIKKGRELLDLIRIATIYLAFTGLVYLPWPIKNYKETNSISVNTFITGKPGNRLININQVMRNARAVEAETNVPNATDKGSEQK